MARPSSDHIDVVTKFDIDDLGFSKLSADEFKALTIKLAKGIRKAKMHARGMKTLSALHHAVDDLSEVLRLLNISYREVVSRKFSKSQNICPDHYTHTRYGFPNYDTGYVTENCSISSRITDLVTFVFLIDKRYNETASKLIDGVYNHVGNKSNIYIGVLNDKFEIPQSLSSFSNVKIVKFKTQLSQGKAWNRLVEHVTTPYIFLGRDMVAYDSDVQIDRMVREIESLKVTTIGGSSRNIITGKWKIGCFQRAWRNYTIIYEEGYAESAHECLFCDHIDGAFLIRRNVLHTTKFNENLPDVGIFEDFFIRLPGEVALCADSMMNRNKSESTTDSDWKQFGRLRDLYKIQTPSGKQIYFGCSYDYPCDPWNSYSPHPCCNEELANTLAFTLETCEKYNVICEMYDGNLVGVVKMYKVLPWELDGDIKYYYKNTSFIKTLTKHFNNSGYELVQNKAEHKCITEEYYSVRYFDVNAKHWRIDFNSYCDLDSYRQRTAGKVRTLLPHHDRYLHGARNPARVVRNKYPGYTQHAEHYNFMDKPDMWATYQEHSFRKCKTPGRQDCLDQYNTDGNIQFSDPIP